MSQDLERLDIWDKIKSSLITLIKMFELIKKAGRGTVYLFRELTWKPQNIREESSMDRLTRYGLSLSSLNHYLDEFDFPKSVGRFPEMFSTYPELSDVIFSSLSSFMDSKSQNYADYSERRDNLKNHLSKDVANYLSNSPKAFRSIFENEGFFIRRD